METKHKNHKKRMAFLGYYTVSEFARLKGVSKQFISKESEKYETIEGNNRRWYKFDDGEFASTIYGSQNSNVDIFLNFGFRKRIKSLAQNDKAIVDVKQLNTEYITIRFYNENGDVLSCLVKTNEVELIEDNGAVIQ